MVELIGSSLFLVFYFNFIVRRCGLVGAKLVIRFYLYVILLVIYIILHSIFAKKINSG